MRVAAAGFTKVFLTRREIRKYGIQTAASTAAWYRPYSAFLEIADAASSSPMDRNQPTMKQQADSRIQRSRDAEEGVEGDRESPRRTALPEDDHQQGDWGDHHHDGGEDFEQGKWLPQPVIDVRSGSGEGGPRLRLAERQELVVDVPGAPADGRGRALGSAEGGTLRCRRVRRDGGDPAFGGGRGGGASVAGSAAGVW